MLRAQRGISRTPPVSHMPVVRGEDRLQTIFIGLAENHNRNQRRQSELSQGNQRVVEGLQEEVRFEVKM